MDCGSAATRVAARQLCSQPRDSAPADADPHAGALNGRDHPREEPDFPAVRDRQHQSIVDGDGSVRVFWAHHPEVSSGGPARPGWMAEYARGALRRKRQELQWASEGTLNDRQRSLLGRPLRQLEWLEVVWPSSRARSRTGETYCELGEDFYDQ